MAKKILIAESDIDMKALLIATLNKEYKVDLVDNGKEIMKEIYELPDLFIMNSEMEDISVPVLCNFLRNNVKSRDIPILVIASSKDTDMDRDIDANSTKYLGDEMLEKPFSGADLLKTVKHALGIRITDHS